MKPRGWENEICQIKVNDQLPGDERMAPTMTVFCGSDSRFPGHSSRKKNLNYHAYSLQVGTLLIF